jgi:hypothetical protein
VLLQGTVRGVDFPALLKTAHVITVDHLVGPPVAFGPMFLVVGPSESQVSFEGILHVPLSTPKHTLASSILTRRSWLSLSNYLICDWI